VCVVLNGMCVELIWEIPICTKGIYRARQTTNGQKKSCYTNEVIKREID